MASRGDTRRTLLPVAWPGVYDGCLDKLGMNGSGHPELVQGLSLQEATLAAGCAEPGRVAHQATRPASARRIDETRNGAPGTCTRRCGSMKTAKMVVNRKGPIIPAIPRTLPLAPWSRPCSVGSTRRVIRLCTAGLER